MKTTKSKLEQAARAKAIENKFETLCDNVQSQQKNWSNRLTNILDLKNELLEHSMPPALMLKLTVAHSELYRSQMDLIAPVQELVRLVTVYKQSLEDKSIALKRIDEENDRRRLELDIAVGKLKETHSCEKQWRRDRTLNNWERVFCKAALNKTHGRRWKFVISKVKQRAALGLSVFNPLVDYMSGDDEGDHNTRNMLAPRLTYGSTTASSPGLTKQSAISTHFTASAVSTKQSTRQSSLMSSSLKIDTETEDEESEPLPTKQIRSPTIYKSPAIVKKKIQTVDSSVSTEDWEYDTLLNIQVYNPIGLKLPFTEISCQLSLLGLTRDCDVIDASDESNYEELQFLFESEEHKRLGFKRGTSLGALLEEEISDQLEITIHSSMERKIFAICTIPVEDLSDSQPEVNLKINPDDIVPKPFPMYALEGDVTAPCGYLPIFCVWKLTKREKIATVATNTDETMMDDDDENLISDEFSHTKVSSSSPALSRKSVSVMIPTPKPPSESNTPEPMVNEPIMDKTEEAMKRDEVALLTEECEIARTHAQDMAITHAQELERLQYEYELRLEGMAKALEMLKIERSELQEGDYSQTPISLVSCFTPATRPSSTSDAIQSTPSGPMERRTATTPSMSDIKKKKQRYKNNLPRDFFERMEYFTKSSIARHHQLMCRVRDEVQAHTEGAMATQHRLAKRTPTSDSPDSGINEATQDLSLPAIFMPSKTGHVVFSPKAGRYFHPPGSKEPRLSQAPSVFQLPHMQHAPVLNLFDLSEQNVVERGPGWLYKTCKDVTNKH